MQSVGKKVMELLVVGDFTVTELAVKLQCSESAVYNSIAKNKKNLHVSGYAKSESGQKQKIWSIGTGSTKPIADRKSRSKPSPMNVDLIRELPESPFRPLIWQFLNCNTESIQ